MPRMFGVDIPADKRIEAALPYIYGIGPTLTRQILEQTEIDPNIRAKDLTDAQVDHLVNCITERKILV